QEWKFRRDCEPSQEFKTMLSNILSAYAPSRLEIVNVFLGKALADAISSSFSDFPKANQLHFPLGTDQITIKDEEITVDDIEKILINFKHFNAISPRFLRGPFLETLIAETSLTNISIETDGVKVAPSSIISLSNFHKVERFELDCFTTTIESLFAAIENRLNFAPNCTFCWKLNVNDSKENVVNQINEECKKRH
ncbi:hypothetical protein PMAYCL1PPCAC_04639, partial [Pristionchus mayeri]